MAPAIRKVTQTIIQPDATSVVVVALGNTKRWTTLSCSDASPVTTPSTPIVQAFGETETPVGSYPKRSTGLSSTDKGVIAGCAVSVVVLLLLLCWCYLRPSPWSFRLSPPKAPSVPKEPPPEATPADPDPAPADHSPRTKKSVTIAADLPRYSGKQRVSPFIRFTAVTGLEIREGRSGPIRFMIRDVDRPRRKRRRRHRSKGKGPEDG
ncbi:hypothetical protein N7535_001312 [Penicillium sp. DV-2018c]|nr:hypothetical protein N7535_001312 [Penicillium sp. DV-2018c]